MDRSALTDAGGGLQHDGRTRHEIVLFARQFSGERSRGRQAKRIRSLRTQPVAVGAKGEYGLDCMAAIGQLPANMQRKVELGRRDLFRGQGAELPGVRPDAILAFTRAATSSCAVTSDAAHANRAS